MGSHPQLWVAVGLASYLLLGILVLSISQAVTIRRCGGEMDEALGAFTIVAWPIVLVFLITLVLSVLGLTLGNRLEEFFASRK